MTDLKDHVNYASFYHVYIICRVRGKRTRESSRSIEDVQDEKRKETRAQKSTKKTRFGWMDRSAGTGWGGGSD